MQKARISALKKEIETEFLGRSAVHEVLVVMKTPNGWLGVDSEKPIDIKLSGDCDRVCTSGSYGRASQKGQFVFPIKALEAGVIVRFSGPIRRTTQDSFAREIDQVFHHSMNAFDARHDTATGLRNKKAFEDDLNAALAKQSVRPTTAGTVQAQAGLSVIALDIDHFKQANDTFGHIYGDIVLQAFAHRLEGVAARLEKRLASQAEVSVYRTGGEEFCILVFGGLPSSEIDDLAEEFRQSIANVPLPSETEWSTLTHVQGSTNLQLPHTSERNVTTSIGIATITGSLAIRNVKATAARLKQQADTALYRAKSGGRNTIRRFSDILSSYGTVLEHHPDTNVVAIDIGRQVGVSVGQEFVVFHPEFAGTRPFLFSDGRTKRRLGNYPRYPAGRIIVFDVQPEISFCRVVETKVVGLFPLGATLELVPVGAISPLISGSGTFDSFGVSNLVAAEALPERVASVLKQAADGAVLVFDLENVEGLAEAHGTAFINRSLVSLVTAIKEASPLNSIIGQVQATQVAVAVVGMPRAKVETLAVDCMVKAEADTGDRAQFRCGIFTTAASPTTADESALNVDHALEFARYAAALRGADTKVHFFKSTVARDVVQQSYAAGKYKEGLADYRRLRELGINTAHLNNIGALAALGARDFETANDAMARALALLPQDNTLNANAGFIQYIQGNYAAAGSFFDQIMNNAELVAVYRAPLAISFAARFREGYRGRSKDEIADLIRESLQDETTGNVFKERLLEALKWIDEPTAASATANETSSG